MSGATPKPSKKNVTAKKKPVESGASVQALFTQSRRCVEAAAIVRAVSQQIGLQFHSNNDMVLPLLLLQRHGEGPRAATTEAIVDATTTLEGVARQFEARARELLGLPALGETRQDESDERLIVDEVVPRESAEAEFKMAAKKK